jgi:hypothetical protein
LVLSVSNEKQQLHLRQVTIKNAVEEKPVYNEMLVSVLILHPRRILPMRAAIEQNTVLKKGKLSRRKRSLGRKSLKEEEEGNYRAECFGHLELVESVLTRDLARWLP